MSKHPLIVLPVDFEADGWPPEQAAALAQLHAASEELRSAFGGIIEAGIKPSEALAACGYEVPLFARVMVNSLLAA